MGNKQPSNVTPLTNQAVQKKIDGQYKIQNLYLYREFNIFKYRNEVDSLEAEEIQYISKKYSSVHKFTIHGYPLTQALSKILAIPRWESLVVLSLNNNNLNDQSMKFISQMNIANLIFLDLNNNLIGRSGLERLVDFQFNCLTQLFLQRNQIDDKAAIVLAKFHFKKLESLNLTDNTIGPDGVQALVKNPMTNTLRMLLLNRNRIRNLGCLSLMKAYWPKLQILELNMNIISSQGFGYIGQIDCPSIYSLKLERNSDDFHNLQRLTDHKLADVSFSNRMYRNAAIYWGIKTPMTGSWKSSINYLSLNMTILGAKGCRYLSRAKLSSLKSLSLACCRIDDFSVIELVKMEGKSINNVNLRNNIIYSSGLRQLTKMNWKELKTLNLNNNFVEFKGVQDIIQAECKKLETICLKAQTNSKHILSKDEQEIVTNQSRKKWTKINLKF